MFGKLLFQKKIVWGLVIVLFFAAMLAHYLYRAPKRHYSDFRVYHHTAKGFLSGEDIYFRDKEEVTPFKYSPFFAFLVSPLGTVPLKSAAAIFFVINFATVFLIFFAVRRLFLEQQEEVPPWACWIYGLTFLLSFRFILMVWQSGQVNLVMCALTAWSLVCVKEKKAWLAGALLAAAILFKYLPAIFIPYLLFRKEFKAVAWTCAFSVLWLLLPALFIGMERNTAYVMTWIPSIIQTSLDQGSYFDYKNQSIYSMVLQFFSDSGYGINVLSLAFDKALLLGRSLALALYALAFLPRRGGRDSKIDYAILFICMALFNPNAWMVNFVSLIPAYILLLGYLWKNRVADKFVLVLVILGFVVSVGMAEDIAGNNIQNLGETFSNVTFGSLLILGALCRMKFFPYEKTE